MALTSTQKYRLDQAVFSLRHAPSWGLIRQFCIAESASDQPDYEGLKSFVMATVDKMLDTEIQGGQDRRASERP